MKTIKTRPNLGKMKAKNNLRVTASSDIPVFSNAAVARARQAKPSTKLKKASAVLHKVSVVA